MRKAWRAALAAMLVIGLLATSGCIIRREAVNEPASSRTRTTTANVPLGGATDASIKVSMGAGELSVKGADLSSDAGSDVLRGEFTFAPAELEPLVSSTTDSESGTIEVEIKHPDVQGFNFLGRNLASSWSLQLNTEVPSELEVAMGAGDANLDLNGTDLSDLRIDMGAGDLELDLTGPRPRDLDARVTTGAGRVVVQLPSDIGVRVSGREDGVGDWTYEGFTVDGDYLVNDAYGASGTTIELDIQRGIGEVELVLVD